MTCKAAFGIFTVVRLKVLFNNVKLHELKHDAAASGTGVTDINNSGLALNMLNNNTPTTKTVKISIVVKTWRSMAALSYRPYV